MTNKLFFHDVNILTKGNINHYVGLTLSITNEICGNFKLKIIGEFYFDISRRSNEKAKLKNNEIVQVTIVQNGLKTRFSGFVNLTTSYLVTDANKETKSDRQFWELMGLPNTIEEDQLGLFDNKGKTVDMRVFYSQNLTNEKVALIVASNLRDAEQLLTQSLSEYDLISNYAIKELDLEHSSLLSFNLS